MKSFILNSITSCEKVHINVRNLSSLKEMRRMKRELPRFPKQQCQRTKHQIEWNKNCWQWLQETCTSKVQGLLVLFLHHLLLNERIQNQKSLEFLKPVKRIFLAAKSLWMMFSEC